MKHHKNVFFPFIIFQLFNTRTYRNIIRVRRLAILAVFFPNSNRPYIRGITGRRVEGCHTCNTVLCWRELQVIEIDLLLGKIWWQRWQTRWVKSPKPKITQQRCSRLDLGLGYWRHCVKGIILLCKHVNVYLIKVTDCIPM